ncbi:unnamed protein product [Blepharisma stoltei]|uniref:Calpain catalytic domain-containing protein n=1 Tax=Blepharisma stoltei TaxID=1481888 RepID=A0AAU9I991_9CILI|nr:unnamed protein product [Blepharisma stoltei]
MPANRQKIHEGIVLITDQANSSTMLMSIENSMMKVLSFTVDLSGSVKVTIEEDPNTLVRTVDIPPKQTVLVATIKLGRGCSLSTKFKFGLKAPPADMATSMIEKSLKKMEGRIQLARDNYRWVDFNTLQRSQVPAELGIFIDPYFSPCDRSIFLGSDKKLSTAVQWRRPKSFFKGNYSVFLDDIEPNDIKQGQLGDCWFMCALASLAERPALVERLFESRESSDIGFYQVWFCKSGEWVRVTVDDYFPCFPKDTPIFSRSHGNELWVLLLEKAYAKLHGSYSLLKGGWAAEGMMDLTGCPTLNLDFNNEESKQLIQNDRLWDMLKRYDNEGSLISASTAGEDRWTETGGPNKKGGLVPGHAYTVIQCKEAYGNRLLNIRNPWGNFEWDGDWSDRSTLWTDEMKEAIRPILDDNDGTFWMSYNDFIVHFTGVNICRVDNYHECRIKGFFERKEVDGNEIVASKWYYCVQAREDTHVIVGVHQEDERMYGVVDKRANIDLSIVVLDVTDGGCKLFQAKESVVERQVEIDLDLQGGKTYIIYPRTTGCALSRPQGVNPEKIVWHDNGELHPLFESTIKDVFRKANRMIGEDLSYTEFNELMKKAKVKIPEEQFRELINSLPSHEDGLTQEGLIEFMREMFKRYGEETIRKWLVAWGYDDDLFSVQSRAFCVTFHSPKRLKIQMRNAERSGLHEKVNQMLIQRSGEKKGITDGVQLYCLMEKSANAFTYGAYNDNRYQVKATLDCTNSEGLSFSGRTNIIQVTIPPKEWRILAHCQIAKNSTACRLRPVLKVKRG